MKIVISMLKIVISIDEFVFKNLKVLTLLGFLTLTGWNGITIHRVLNPNRVEWNYTSSCKNDVWVKICFMVLWIGASLRYQNQKS